ncbi:hypothetical protein TNCV_673671 [Trichonephila clavipes]|uniref:Uncharacterized protein n=1 Tax=Trichonephila clavipes TaxID=2585209 RepID=A0A8X7BJE1_TRICX|nr:hypothetical protein TNCV_673671 [Trichonephila clavipes]
MGQCVQLRTRNYGALDQTARVCFGVLCANRTREVKRDFVDLRIRRSEGRVVNTPCCLKRVVFEDTRRKDRKKNMERESKREETRREREREKDRRKEKKSPRESEKDDERRWR